MLEMIAKLKDAGAPLMTTFQRPARTGMAHWGDGMPWVEFAFTVSRKITSVTVHDHEPGLRLVVSTDAIMREPAILGIVESLEEHLASEMY